MEERPVYACADSTPFAAQLIVGTLHRWDAAMSQQSRAVQRSRAEQCYCFLVKQTDLQTLW